MSEFKIKIMENMFIEYIKDKAKKFVANNVIDNGGGQSGCIVWGCYVSSVTVKLEYNYDDVKMKYYSRFTTHLGDHDVFIDKYVECDGIILLDLKYC